MQSNFPSLSFSDIYKERRACFHLEERKQRQRVGLEMRMVYLLVHEGYEIRVEAKKTFLTVEASLRRWVVISSFSFSICMIATPLKS